MEGGTSRFAFIPSAPFLRRTKSRFESCKTHGFPRYRRPTRKALFTACADGSSSGIVHLRDESKEAEKLLIKFWQLTNEGRFLKASESLTDDAVYNDMLYAESFKGRRNIETLMRKMENYIPVDKLRFVLDDLAPSPNKVGARWHVELKNGKTLPFSRGCSMYTLKRADNDELEISEVWDFPETPLKAASVVLPLLKAVARFL